MVLWFLGLEAPCELTFGHLMTKSIITLLRAKNLSLAIYLEGLFSKIFSVAKRTTSVLIFVLPLNGMKDIRAVIYSIANSEWGSWERALGSQPHACQTGTSTPTSPCRSVTTIDWVAFQKCSSRCIVFRIIHPCTQPTMKSNVRSFVRPLFKLLETHCRTMGGSEKKLNQDCKWSTYV